jgi:hypothetical protein
MKPVSTAFRIVKTVIGTRVLETSIKDAHGIFFACQQSALNLDMGNKTGQYRPGG